MEQEIFNERLEIIVKKHEELLERKNIKLYDGNGIFERYKYPVLTREHTPIFWRYDLNYETNPYCMERLGINAVFNPGAIELNNKIYLIARVEGCDRKSFFAVAESESGVDNFRFWKFPVAIPDLDEKDTNVYDMRLVKHEDGWIYGTFCVEDKDPNSKDGDLSSAVAQCGIVRTKDLINWDRLDNLKTSSSQQRNVVLHPEFVDGKYAFYTRPQDDFILTGSGAGICWGFSESIEHAIIEKETVIDKRYYHTIKEVKNGEGPAPIKTEKGWIHIAHGVRNTAAGMRYVLYTYLTDLKHPEKVLRQPGGYFIAPFGEERVGDVSNVVFCNGIIVKDSGDVYIYYASSDTRVHVATTTKDRLLDYVLNTPEDSMVSSECVKTRSELISKNINLAKDTPNLLIKKAMF